MAITCHIFKYNALHYNYVMRKNCPLQITFHYFENVIHNNYITITITITPGLPVVDLRLSLLSSSYIWYTPDYPLCHLNTSVRSQTILTTIQLHLVDLRLSLLPSNYLLSTPVYPHCHPSTSGLPQTILTAIQLPLVYPRLSSLQYNYLW